MCSHSHNPLMMMMMMYEVFAWLTVLIHYAVESKNTVVKLPKHLDLQRTTFRHPNNIKEYTNINVKVIKVLQKGPLVRFIGEIHKLHIIVCLWYFNNLTRNIKL